MFRHSVSFVICFFSNSTSAEMKRHDKRILNFLIIRLRRGIVENRLHPFKNRYAVNVAVTVLMIFARVNELRQLVFDFLNVITVFAACVQLPRRETCRFIINMQPCFRCFRSRNEVLQFDTKQLSSYVGATHSEIKISNFVFFLSRMYYNL
jgi:hypothetical protein